jgi:hypothetical protein
LINAGIDVTSATTVFGLVRGRLGTTVAGKIVDGVGMLQLGLGRGRNKGGRESFSALFATPFDRCILDFEIMIDFTTFEIANKIGAPQILWNGKTIRHQWVSLAYLQVE